MAAHILIPRLLNFQRMFIFFAAQRKRTQGLIFETPGPLLLFNMLKMKDNKC